MAVSSRAAVRQAFPARKPPQRLPALFGRRYGTLSHLGEEGVESGARLVGGQPMLGPKAARATRSPAAPSAGPPGPAGLTDCPAAGRCGWCGSGPVPVVLHEPVIRVCWKRQGFRCRVSGAGMSSSPSPACSALSCGRSNASILWPTRWSASGAIRSSSSSSSVRGPFARQVRPVCGLHAAAAAICPLCLYTSMSSERQLRSGPAVIAGGLSALAWRHVGSVGAIALVAFLGFGG